MRTDRELLGLAAKAAGVEIATWSNAQAGGFTSQEYAGGKFWNPLTDDGDALRLAARLSLDISWDRASGYVDAFCVMRPTVESNKELYVFDAEASVRRAIVRAAAEIGAAM
jgi:hypothetical protein